jgi:small subunit ribosomal protein S15e
MPADGDPPAAADAPAVVTKRRTFRKFTFRGVDLDALLTLKPVDVLPLLTARARRKINRGLTRKPLALIKKLNKAKKEAPEHDKPAAVKTHLRNMIIIPEMIGSVVGVYNGKVFNAVEIKPEVCVAGRECDGTAR